MSIELLTKTDNNATVVPTDLWDAAQKTLQTKFSHPIYEMWIRPMRALSCDGRELLLATQSIFARDWVENRLKPELSSAIEEAFGTPLDLRFTVTEASGGAAQIAPAALLAPVLAPVESAKTAALNPRYTFDELVIGNDNRFAHAAALAVASAPARAYNPLFMYGGVGLGKTHLLHAIGHRVRADKPDARIEYVTSEQFNNALVRAVETNSIAAFRAKYRECDVLLLDDVQFFAGRERVQEEFFHTFNALHEAGCQIVIVSDRAPKEIATLEARLRSRFEWGLIADVQRPDVETREAILRRKATHEKVSIGDDVLSFIARVVTTNVRELEGALVRVVAYASVTKVPVTLSVAMDALKGVVETAAVKRISVGTIKETVASAHGITVKEMDNGRRDQRLAKPRQIAMFITTELTTYSLPQIAREYGKKDHTTIMYARNKIKDAMERDESFRNKVRHLIAACQMGGAV